MKAISCPQCGALIKEVSGRQAITQCCYCGARVLLPRGSEYDLEINESKEDVPNENIKKVGTKVIWNSPFSDPHIYGETFHQQRKSGNSFVAAAVIICAVFFVLIAIVAGVASKKRTEKAKVYPTPRAASTPFSTDPPYAINLKPVTEEPEITFDINYRVSWDSAVSEQHIELPSLKHADFPSNDLKTLKKTVFAQKIIRVKVRIDTSGEVTDAKAVSGHKILREAAESAARASYFNERKKPINTVLTYYFQIRQIE